MNKKEFKKAVRLAKEIYAYVRINDNDAVNLVISKQQALRLLVSEDTMVSADFVGGRLYIG